MLALLWALPAHARDAPSLVLFLHSYDSAYQWTRDQEQGATEVLASLGDRIAWRNEYLDARRERRPEIRAQVAALLAAKYADVPPRIIVATDDTAVEFLLTHPALFADVPVVFGGVNSLELARQLPRHRFTGVTEPTNAASLVDQLLALRATTRRLFLVTDGNRVSVEFRQGVERTMRDRRVAVTYLSGETLTFEQILAALRRDTQPEDLVILRPVKEDRAGQPLDGDRTVAAVIAASRAPVVSPHVSVVGQGLLAGVESQGLEHGRLLGAKARAVLQGTPVSELPFEEAMDEHLLFDAQQLARWGLSEDALPPGALVGNRSPSFYRANKAVIWTGGGLLMLQSIIIGALVRNVRSRRRAQRTLERQAAALAESHRDLDRAHQSLLHEQEQRRLVEDALRQAQKMDALGRLAGGVAHDFNNLLTVILGHTALLGERLPAGGDLATSAQEIRQASEQAATLTRQLLAFSRKQDVRVGPQDVGTVVRNIEPIIRRLLPAHVEIRLRLTPRLPAVLLGDGQIEQILLNLAANARDAMPDGGWLEIETSEVRVDEPLLADPDVGPGHYLRLRVTDNGLGMDSDTQRHIFEPFFTTKAAGHGTGVGLATVYGIVKQHHGGVTVTSAPGQGTTLTLYLPFHGTRTAEAAGAGAATSR